MIQGSHITSNFGGQFMQNKHNFPGIPRQGGGEYEYEIMLPNSHGKGGETVQSNPSSAAGHYSNDVNINVKKSMIKMGINDIRDRDMDMSPKSSKNEISF